MRFFAPTFQFEWNAATSFDWIKIKNLAIVAWRGKQDQKINLDSQQLAFESLLNHELSTIDNQFNCGIDKINYLIAKYEDQPIAFITSQLNPESGKIELRWTIFPRTNQFYNLEERMMYTIAKYYKNFEITTNQCTFNSSEQIAPGPSFLLDKSN